LAFFNHWGKAARSEPGRPPYIQSGDIIRSIKAIFHDDKANKKHGGILVGSKENTTSFD
jgi:hypothetical protein